MQAITVALRRLWHDTEGLTSTEYALLLALVAFAAVTAFKTLGGTVTNVVGSSREGIAAH